MSNWRPLEQTQIPNDVYYWIKDSNSLTQKLQNKYPNFKVVVVTENIIPTPSSIQKIITTKTVMCREVNLCAGKIALVYAKSFIPTTCYELHNLGNNPLGEILFHQAQRGIIEVNKKNGNWGRRSIFTFKNHKILVCEFFLTPLYA